ncbi:hypothetical protein DYBT9275_02101 [Dyadobacter sp. CECT 9275]|uniref:DUF2157 domain-containing protein n=1 Tax=Dyadobacter helix TaxID=2822344 RepID=A0A916N441_9BACT|nr:hypothetical protein [Dyadobacter sp. CECT 9275]CAG4998886.1 hypothetical protein DYBT9275_02101 [Dyadobacter sp. CECT 9275]
MKKAYNITWIRNLYIQEISDNWHASKLLTDDQLKAVKESFPEEFYRPGIFVKIGLFIFTIVACSFFTGFLSIFFLSVESQTAWSFLSLFSAGCFIVAMEYLIRERKLYHSGTDNALLYSAFGGFLIPFFVFFDQLDISAYAAIILVILTILVRRYADFLMTIGAVITLFVLVATLMFKTPLGKTFLPFGFMIVSAALYFCNVKFNKDIYYAHGKMAIDVIALSVFYLGGNYYIVREGNALINELHLPVSPQIAFAPAFYAFTFLIPLAYILGGLKTHNRSLLIVGLISLGFSVFTYRYYFDFMPVEHWITLLGAGMILLAVLFISLLKKDRFRITDLPHRKRKYPNLEAILIAQQAQHVSTTDQVEFGEGDFGGGGAETSY